MSYHIYSTEAIVLGSSDRKESGRIFALFTRELGLVRAYAEGVRDLKSKLRYTLQDFSICEVSMVRGKDFWRITSARGEKTLCNDLRKNGSFFAFVKILRAIENFVAGEEKNEVLFDIVMGSANFLLANKLSGEELKNVEAILMLRIMHNLGYVASKESFANFLVDSVWNSEMLKMNSDIRPLMINEINRAIEVSQMNLTRN